MTLGAEGLAVSYLVAATLFILGLKGLTHPTSARRGNYYAMAGMLLAVAATMLNPAVKSHAWIAAGIAGGAGIGTIVALKIKMPARPHLAAALPSLGGLPAVRVAVGTYLTPAHGGGHGYVFLSELFAGS